MDSYIFSISCHKWKPYPSLYRWHSRSIKYVNRPTIKHLTDVLFRVHEVSQNVLTITAIKLQCQVDIRAVKRITFISIPRSLYKN